MGNPIRGWLPNLDRCVWILAAGRLLSQVGIGFVLFYAPIFFVNQVGLSATQVGLGVGSQSLSGLVGRFLGGSMTDSPRWGRRKTLLLSALISAIADGVFLLSNNFPVFVAGNLLMGFGVGLYWPATETIVADVTNDKDHNEAFALVRLADSLGLGVGVSLGGVLISTTQQYRLLFAIDGVSFLLFFAIIYSAIAETRPEQEGDRAFLQGWNVALRDTLLLIYVSVNIVFTGYIAQIQSTLPVYLNTFIAGQDGDGLSEATLSALFTGHVVLTALCQLPVARLLKPLAQPRALMISACLWGIGFTLVWTTGIKILSQSVVGAGLALAIMAIAVTAYTPIASSFVVMLAPEALRGVYLSVNSMCWAIGYFIGPPIGGWALDQSQQVAHSFWLMAAMSIVPVLAILYVLEQRMECRD
ncbi:MFS transporter [Oscillatoria sp. CS-180]|uniref:MFS transporter n=1 Tax=Oscillatoria sp. CS-180 TaxID=3021720 RepID=UPI00232C6D67|nr:MFS transporter [Oscillatoria sp. CS-180]MDB9528160.1 MFS transporter [Oscillatoria sp. CS-180]